MAIALGRQIDRNPARKAEDDCWRSLIDRRAVTLGMASVVAMTGSSFPQGNTQAAGCLYLQAACSFSEKGADGFPGFTAMSENADMALGALGVELSLLLQIAATPALYDDSDSGPDGNAGATNMRLFQAPPGSPVSDGTVVFGSKCYNVLKAATYQSAAIAAVYAHEVGHLLQKKHVSIELFNLRNQDKSVVREELHADYVCGYYAAIRKQRQPDWAAVIQKIIQYRFGDYDYANPQHHGTPAERQAAVEAGFKFGSSGLKAPVLVAHSGLEYVRSLVLDRTSNPRTC